jgi:hypothetical protein
VDSTPSCNYFRACARHRSAEDAPGALAAPTLAGRDPSDEEERGGSTLSDDTAAETQTSTSTSTEDAVLLFIGGPLDGRVEVRAARHGDPLPTVTHVHLHGGPKVVHRYDLEPLIDGVGIYNLRPPARKPARDTVD